MFVCLSALYIAVLLAKRIKRFTKRP